MYREQQTSPYKLIYPRGGKEVEIRGSFIVGACLRNPSEVRDGLAQAIHALAPQCDLNDKLPLIYKKYEGLWTAYETLPITRKLCLRREHRMALKEAFKA